MSVRDERSRGPLACGAERAAGPLLADGAADAPSVSVCIPAYNGAVHLARAIRSVLEQSFRDLELLVIDDASSDDTRAVVAGFADPRIFYLRNEQNVGAEANWNRCLRAARGRYFKLLPQDDTLHPRCLEKQVQVLELDRDGAVALVFCARSIVDPRGRVVMTRGYARAAPGIVSARELVAACVLRGTNVIGEPASVLFRRELAVRTGGFDGSIPYVIDLDYWVRLLAHGAAYYLPERLASFRVSQGSWSVAIGRRQSEEFSRFIDKVARSSGVAVPWLVRVSGKCMARVNSRLRLALYHRLLKPR